MMKKWGPIRSFLAGTLLTIIGLVSCQSASAAPVSVHDDTFYIENHAPGWPLASSVRDLSNGTGLTFKTVKKCREDVRCIRISSVANIPGNTIGRTHRARSGHQVHWANVKLENEWGNKRTQAQKANLVCHELGHAVGLEHTNRHDSCMWPNHWRTRPSHINKGERRLLQKWYGDVT